MVATGFYLLTIFMVIILPVAVYWLSTDIVETKYRAVKHYVIGITAWLIYIMALSKSGFLVDMTLPPRMPLLVIALGVLVFSIFISKKLHGATLLKLPLHFPVYIQSFRIIVELLIYGTFLNGILPERVTFEGLNFDILVGISALPIGFLVQTKRLGKTGLLIWNVISCAILTLTLYAFMSSFYLLGLSSAAQIHQFLSFPYILLPSVLLIFAFFYHILSIKQALQK